MKKYFLFSLTLLVILGVVFYPSAGANPRLAESRLPASSVPAAPALKNDPTAPPQPTRSPILAPTRPAPGPAGPKAVTLVSSTARPLPTRAPTPAAGPFLPVRLDTLAMFSRELDGMERVAQVYLPGEYAQNPTRRYPVLYAFDGQQLPEMNFEQQLIQLLAAQQIEPLIVVAVFSTEGDLRREELGAGLAINFLGWGTLSQAFNQFVVSELVPKVNRTYRTLADAAHTGIMGWSLGGLAAFTLAWQNPDVFGILGALSPSFWWRTDSQPGEELQARVIPNLVSASTKRPGLRIWFEAGTAELPYSDVDHNGVIDMIQDVQDVYGLLAQKGYQANVDMVYREVEGGQHELSTWETVLPEFLRFAYGVK